MAHKILVVDDDPETLILIGVTVERRDFEVIKVESCADALKWLAENSADLVVLDVMMPNLDGFEVCRQLKSNPRTAELPVIMLTAKAQTASQIEGFRVGAADYITKPVHPQDLVDRTQGGLDRLQVEKQTGARVIGVAGARGGVGATRVAVNVALVLAVQPRVILVDLEPNGTAAIHLGLSPQHGLSDLRGGEDDEPVDPARIEAALTSHASGLRLLAATENPIEPARAEAILGQLLALCDVCIIDLGSGLSPISRALAPRSDAFVLAFDSDRITLTQANRLMLTVTDAGLLPDSVKLVWINRLGAPADIAVTAIHAVLGRDPMLMISPAPDALYQALEGGQPVVAGQPNIPIAKQMRQLALMLYDSI